MLSCSHRLHFPLPWLFFEIARRGVAVDIIANSEITELLLPSTPWDGHKVSCPTSAQLWP